MYIDIDGCGRVSLMEMDAREASALAKMIRGACLEERRTFNRILKELEKETGS